ncbi:MULTISPECIES: hypothetical protein [unclassified Nostoc]|uniref:hypothetical protein n=1 Tax=unclassified Nostoc TaxID=2593658 RepID=UPI0011813157|nr:MULTISPECIES: hypothetical protein [unclassified Nostoc]MCW5318079.1 hypothetical protein [Nostoc sp. KVJ3]
MDKENGHNNKNGRRNWTQIHFNTTHRPTYPPNSWDFLQALRSLAAIGITITKTFILHTGIEFEQFSFSVCYFLDVFGT